MNSENLQKGKKFGKDYQPKNRRQSTKFLTELLTKKLNKKNEIIVEGMVCDNVLVGIDNATGEKREFKLINPKLKFKLINPNKEVLVMVLLREAAKGNVHAINTIFDRIEGKPIFTAEVDLPGITSIGFDDGPEE